VYEITLMEDGSVELTQAKRNAWGAAGSKTVYTTEANMPDDLRTKLSALKMVTPPDGYEDIGQRVNDTIFWIYE
jgi:hypothetical protein